MNFEAEETWHTLSPRPRARQAMSRLAKMNRTMTPPAGLQSADEIRQYFPGQAKAFDESVEGPAEIQAAKDYRAGIESATYEELMDQYAKATNYQV